MVLIYEINTRIWIRELSIKYQREIKLNNIPREEIEYFKESGFDAVWLMGVWLESKKSRDLALLDPMLAHELKTALPDLTPEDVASSPYSITGYEVQPVLGGGKGILDLKERLNKCKIKLFLDFVPNHTALDHVWIKKKTDLYINGSKQDLRKKPELFFRADNPNRILAHGKDLYFPSWKDTAQLNYFNPDTRKAMKDILSRIALLCDGVRCDMAMLILKRIHREIWGSRVFGDKKFKEHELEFWQEAIPAIKKQYPEFIFIAEAYWGLESELLSMGFDYAYDKPFYDALKQGRIAGIKACFSEDIRTAYKKLHFVENHDEARAVEVFGREKSKAAALITAIAPGSCLFHQGQLEGFRYKLPVQLIRSRAEEIDTGIQAFYKNLLSSLKNISHLDSKWQILDCAPAWENSYTCNNFLALFSPSGYLAVVNYSDFRSQCYTRPNVSDIRYNNLIFKDMLGPEEYFRPKDDIMSRGLYLDMPPYGFHLFKITGA